MYILTFPSSIVKEQEQNLLCMIQEALFLCQLSVAIHCDLVVVAIVYDGLNEVYNKK